MLVLPIVRGIQNGYWFQNRKEEKKSFFFQIAQKYPIFSTVPPPPVSHLCLMYLCHKKIKLLFVWPHLWMLLWYIFDVNWKDMSGQKERNMLLLSLCHFPSNKRCILEEINSAWFDLCPSKKNVQMAKKLLNAHFLWWIVQRSWYFWVQTSKNRYLYMLTLQSF